MKYLVIITQDIYNLRNQLDRNNDHAPDDQLQHFLIIIIYDPKKIDRLTSCRDRTTIMVV